MKTILLRSLLLLAAVGPQIGCASVINGTTQEVGFRSLPSGATVRVAGQSATTPAKLELSRSQDHTVTFTKEGYPERQTNLKQKLDGAFYGNLALGGIIGMAVDMGNGSAYSLSPSKVEMNMETGIAREFDDNEPIRTVAAATTPIPSAPPGGPAPGAAAVPSSAGAAPSTPAKPVTGTAGIGGIPLVVKGVVNHPETGKPVDCPILLAWKLEDRLDGVKSAAFNREVGGDRATLTGLTPQQLTTGMAMRDACQQAAASSTSTRDLTPAPTNEPVPSGPQPSPYGTTMDANSGVTCSPIPCTTGGTR